MKKNYIIQACDPSTGNVWNDNTPRSKKQAIKRCAKLTEKYPKTFLRPRKKTHTPQ